MKSNLLTERACATAKAGPREQRLFDGGGLYLAVLPSGTKSWRMKYTFAGRERKLVFGPYPTYAQVRAMDVPVVAGDVTDHPYHVIADVSKYVRASLISHPDDAKVRAELWKKARKLGTDAVVNARLGSPNHAFPEMGSRVASGQAVKFLGDAEGTGRPAQAM